MLQIFVHDKEEELHEFISHTYNYFVVPYAICQILKNPFAVICNSFEKYWH